MTDDWRYNFRHDWNILWLFLAETTQTLYTVFMNLTMKYLYISFILCFYYVLICWSWWRSFDFFFLLLRYVKRYLAVCLSCFQLGFFLWPFPVHTEEQEQPLQCCVKTGSVCTRQRRGSLLCRRALRGALPARERRRRKHWPRLGFRSSFLYIFCACVHHCIAFTQKNHNICYPIKISSDILSSW